jgi:hypothetical protein
MRLAVDFNGDAKFASKCQYFVVLFLRTSKNKLIDDLFMLVNFVISLWSSSIHTLANTPDFPTVLAMLLFHNLLLITSFNSTTCSPLHKDLACIEAKISTAHVHYEILH